MDIYPERIPSLESRLGMNVGDFENSVDGFKKFTNAAEYVTENYPLIKNVDGKIIYYIDVAENVKKGVVVIIKNGKIQSMMPSNVKFQQNELT